jgi:hypothetical protein
MGKFMKCYKCGTQDLERFSPSALRKGQKGNTSRLCRECQYVYIRDYRARHKEEIRARSHEYNRRYYRAHASKIYAATFTRRNRGFNMRPSDNNIPALAYRGPQPRVRDWWERQGNFDGGAWNWIPGREEAA